MNVPEPEVRKRLFHVSCLPEGHDEAISFTLTVEYRGHGRWAVIWRGGHYDAGGGRSWGHRWPETGPVREAVTSEEIDDEQRVRDEWLNAHRFDLDTALALARRIAPTLTIRGYTVADALAWNQETSR